MNGNEREEYPQIDSDTEDLIRLLLLSKSLHVLEAYSELEKSGKLPHLDDGKRDTLGAMLIILPSSVTHLEVDGLNVSRSQEAIEQVPEYMRMRWDVNDLNRHMTKLRAKFISSPRRNP